MSAGKTFPQFLEEAKKNHQSLRYNEDFRRRIELIQDFQFQVATNQVEISNDQRYIVAAGIYAPQIKIYDTSELSLKCLRGLDS
jgi:ribosome biogenesis protein ENP2